MSKIFDALNQAKGKPADTSILELIGEEQEPAPGLTPRREEAPPAAPERPPATAAATAPVAGLMAFDQAAIRTLPLQVREFSPVLPFDDTDARASEQYRIVRTKILQHPNKPRMIVVSSPGPGDGKSITTVNIAGALSLKATAQVLIMDADFRRTTIHTQLGFPESVGLADIIQGNCKLEDALIRTQQFPSLYVLPAGERRSNPTELLDSPQWHALCGRMRQVFDYVIIDSPPIAAVADYHLIEAVCDGVIMVIRPEHTKRSICFKAMETVPKSKMLGVVLNSVSDWFLSRPYPYKAYY